MTMEKYWVDGPSLTGDFVSHILTQRSIPDHERFLNPQWPVDLHNPWLLPDCENGVTRVIEAIQKKETIGIVGDYDMDGTPGATLLYQFFTQLAMQAHVILPTREEGYGFQPVFVDRLKDKNVSLILTVDCGIRDFDAVEQARKVGIDVIIIDHHECASTLPQALAVINPKRSESAYPFRELCGTAVAYKFLHAVIERLPSQHESLDRWLVWSLDLVALATLGDMVPLIDENRVLVSYGMKVLRNGRRIGLSRFLLAIGINPSQLTYRDIAYKVIPKLNASGRIEAMDDVLILLSAKDAQSADTVVKDILTRDTQRQLLSKSIYNQAKQHVLTDDLPEVIIVFDAAWHPGVTGLVASRLSEEFKRPTAVLGSLDGVTFRGSMRTSQGVILPELLDTAKGVIEKYGGHNEAAGLTVTKDNLDTFRSLLQSQPLVKQAEYRLETDGTIQCNMITLAGLESLQVCAPWGMGNSEPVWSMTSVMLNNPKWMGEQSNHLKCTLRNGPVEVDCIYFGADAFKDFDFSSPVDLYGTLDINEFRGVKRPQVLLKGIARST